MDLQHHRNSLYPVCGTLLLLTIWELLGRTSFFDGVMPPPSEILNAVLFTPGRSLYFEALMITGRSAIIGYLLGVVIGVCLATLAQLVPVLRAGIVRFGAIANATPIIALGPVLMATIERAHLPIAVAAFFVFFSIFIALLSGYSEATRTHHDLFTVLGASRQRRFLYLEGPAGLPTFTAGLKVAAPAAVVGAIFGEWFGLDTGIGPLLISSMQSYSLGALWGSTLLAGMVGMLAYMLLSQAEKKITRRFR
ncbi:ABC transporter permease [Pusillimonas sp.]|uniref:ABC transporter permease n=1 Tax=Pusillimonas sp. TaxID=3040095 RepID=UPI0037CA6160